MRLGKRLAQARASKGWTIRELERRTGIHNSLINQIETGHVKQPSFQRVVKIAKALDLNVSEIALCK